MKAGIAILLFPVLVGCAPLYPHNTLGEDIGEVALRVVGCPLTLCFSELGLHERRRNQARAEARAIAEQKKQEEYLVKYRAWYETLDEDQRNLEDLKAEAIAQREKDREAMRSIAAINALGQINQGRGIFGPSSIPPSRLYDVPAPPHQPTNCTSTRAGTNVYTSCY
ncbi:MAG: hypothetical protein OEW25_02010 [Nitrospira sp.]|nr:hypothetical protein [Nitrospira sp.]MDH4327374.1 hypothetical protein [Nitrospira sp.]MDH5252073.1 hypothetical protein [Nitrospira sp.]